MLRDIWWCKTCKCEIEGEERLKTHRERNCEIDYTWNEVSAGQDAIRSLADAINSGAPAAIGKGMYLEMQHTHPHLQANLVLAFTIFFRLYGADRSYTDERNAWAKDVCERMAKEV